MRLALATEPRGWAEQAPAKADPMRLRAMGTGEIAAALGLTVRQVHQIEQTAMRKLRKSPAARALLTFVDWELERAPQRVVWARVDAPGLDVATRGLLRALLAERHCGPIAKDLPEQPQG
jgi:hypothetical protein